MPTAAKLVAALAFAFVAALAAHVYWRGLPDGTPAGLMREICGLIGLVCGWWIMGPMAQRARGRIEAMGTGIRTSLTIAPAAVFLLSTVEMLERAMKGRYKTPLDAALGVFERALVLGRPVFQPDVLGVLLLGGLLGGALSYWAGRRWS